MTSTDTITCNGIWLTPVTVTNVPSEWHRNRVYDEATVQACSGCDDMLVVVRHYDGLRTLHGHYVVTHTSDFARNRDVVAAFGVANMEATGQL